MNKVKMLFVAMVIVCIPGVCFSQDTVVKKIKTLVVFYSRDGHTKLVAEKLAVKFNADIEELIDLKKRTGPVGTTAAGKDALTRRSTKIKPLKHDPSGYDIILVGTPSWFSNVTPAVRTFATRYKISDKKIGVFGTAHLTGVEAALKQLSALLSQDQSKTIPMLPLRHRDLVDEVLPGRINELYEEMMSSVGGS